MTWTVDHHDHTTARNDLVALWQEVQAVYSTSEDDPASVVICPQLNPLPIPGLEDIEKEDWKTGKLTIRVLRENGVLVVVLLMLDNKVRAGWGPVVPNQLYRGTIEPGGIAEWMETTYGLPYSIDTGAPGWVVREWFENFCEPSEFFDTTSTTHPGLNGELLATWDDVPYRLVISRPTPTDPWEYYYERVG